MNRNPAHTVLILSYEFPPSAGGGVQRVAKMVRYLPEFGWGVRVLTATPVRGRPMDESLLEEVSETSVVRLPNRERTRLVASLIRPLKGLRGRRSRSHSGEAVGGEQPSGRMPASASIVRAWGLDGAVAWSHAAVREAVRMGRDAPIDAVLASGPPHSVLVAGANAARILGVPFVADFRDSWSSNAYYRHPDHDGRDARSLGMLDRVLATATAVVAVSDPIAEEAWARGAKRALVLPNGYDSEDLPVHRSAAGPLRLTFLGRFYDVTDPAPFFEGLALARASGGPAADIVVDVAGPPSASVESLVDRLALGEVVRFLGYLPRRRALETAAASDVGLVIIKDHPGASAIYTGKLFEYLGMRLPVLLVGPTNGVAAQLIAEAQIGEIVPWGEPEAVAAVLESLASAKSQGRPLASPLGGVIERFERRTQVGEIAAVLDELARAHA